MPEARTGTTRGRGKAAAQQLHRRALSKRGSGAAQGAFPVAALGASAGGLDAYMRLFEGLAADSGMAFVLIQHLDPGHQSMMVDLLAEHTAMRVQQAADGMHIERDHVYIIPPGAYLSIGNGTLRLSRPRAHRGVRMPFDFFLRSLAAACGERAVCVILSGTGSDGSLGLKAIKARNGLVIAQDPTEAGYDGMPRSAIATAAVDLVLSVTGISEALANHAREMHGKVARSNAASHDHALDGHAEIIEFLRTKTSHDFTLYKPGTLQRRIERRKAMAGVADGGLYLSKLQQDPLELELLATDLLINVTSFFRDPPMFKFMAEKIIPDMVRGHASDQPLRIWVAGCSTGEETYSIAMLFLEALDTAGRHTKLQVFASDVDADAVAVAREGVYPESIEADVSPARLARYFVKEGHSYRVLPMLREVVVFAVQDVLGDSPFSHLDLVSCRNLLIYLRPEAQEKVLMLFHFALREGGILFLGGSETVGHLGDRFCPVSKAHRIYRRVDHLGPGEVGFPISAGTGARTLGLQGPQRKPSHGAGLGEVVKKLLLKIYAPASVLINRRYETLYYLGPADRYLQVVSGEPSRDLLAMAREGLRYKLQTAVRQASQQNERTVLTGARMNRDGSPVIVSIAVQPIESDGEALLLVSFLDEPAGAAERGRPAGKAEDSSRATELETELDATRRELQSALRDLELSSDEQIAINEEASSINEEFQSTNEELVTSKEELQSLNEELTALNSQLQETLERQRNTSNDLRNILDSSDIATLFLDKDLRIRFFTPAAKSLFNVVSTDIGRPLADLTPLAADATLLVDARAVLTSLVPLQHEIETRDGTWYIRRILPYHTLDDRTEGVVMTFTDISEVKIAERKIEAARAYSDSIINTIRQPLLVLDRKLRIVSGNDAFYRTFALTPEQAVGQHFAAAGDHLSAIAGLHTFLEQVLTTPAGVADLEAEAELPLLGQRVLLMNARLIHDGLAEQPKVLLAFDDITERRHAAQALEAGRRQAEHANLAKSRFLAAASHDLRQPLQTLSLLQGLLAKKVRDPDASKLLTRFEETVLAMSGMLNALLDINQLEAGNVHPEVLTFPVSTLLERLRKELAYHAAARNLGWRVIPSGLFVRSDPHLLEQLMRNLLSNAVKYTEHGRVLLGCRRRGSKLRIEVWDTGSGIPEAQLQAIFQEFHQLDNPARERNRGLGLGLAIVQRLAVLLGLAIDVRSRPGRGSVFSVEVPLGQPEAARPQAIDQDEAIADASCSGTVLIVEDDPDVREMLELLLKDEGYATMAAADGKRALELAATGTARVDLVVADYNLPIGLNGLQVVASLQEATHQAIPAIILTGDISTGTLREIARHGRVQLNKPVKPEELTGLIRKLLSERRPTATSPARSSAEPGAAVQDPIIFVIDDDSFVRQSLRDVLCEDGRTVETYASGEAFFEVYRPVAEGCLLVDAVMPGMSGFALLQRLKDEGSRLPAIMITGNGDVRMAVRAMQAGAADFVEKPIGGRELLASVDQALERMQDSVKRSAWREAAAARLADLTVRQRQILELVLAGHPSKNIAADLGISQRTVESHRAAIMHKTGSRSLPALVRLALAST